MELVHEAVKYRKLNNTFMEFIVISLHIFRDIKQDCPVTHEPFS